MGVFFPRGLLLRRSPGGGGVFIATTGMSDSAAMAEDRDEAYVENDDTLVIEEPTQRPPQPTYLDYAHGLAMFYLTNPWFILLICVAAYMFYQRVIRTYLMDVGATYSAWQEGRRAAAEIAQQKKNPDLYRDKMEAMDRARARQQALHEAAAREHAEKVKAKEDEKKAEKLKQMESLQKGKGYYNKSEQKTSSSNKLKNDDYSPLMGGGSGSSGACFRPSQRGPAGGGG